MNIFNTLQVDTSKFKTVWALGTMYIAVVFILFMAFSSLFGSLSQKILAYSAVPSIADLTNQDVNSILGILWFVIFLIAVFVILQLVAYAFFESTIWNVIFGRKTTLASSAKFLGFSVLLGVLLMIFDVAILSAVSLIFSSAVKWLLLFPVAKMIVASFALTFIIYPLFVGFALFTKSHTVFATIPQTFKAGFNVKKSGIPFIISAVILLVLNAVIAIFSWIPQILFSVATAVLFAAYLAWFRLYVSKSVKF